MDRLIILVSSTVDGVIDGFEWYVQGGDHSEAALDVFAGAQAWLLGRRTYEGLAEYWPTQTGPWGDTLNPMPKFVASRTLTGPLGWNARLLQGEALEAVRRLKRDLPGDLVVSGCGEFAVALLAGGLVDEVWFSVHPVVWGAGGRPFGGARVRMRLLESTTFDSGVALLRYEPLAA
jgi:dihydrofolate reductase